jgi:hypothetical protein
MIKSRRIKCVGHIVCVGEMMRNAYNILFGKLRPLRGPRYGWEDNIKMDLKKIWLDVMDWVYLDRDRGCWLAHVNMLLNSWSP